MYLIDIRILYYSYTGIIVYIVYIIVYNSRYIKAECTAEVQLFDKSTVKMMANKLKFIINNMCKDCKYCTIPYHIM